MKTSDSLIGDELAAVRGELVRLDGKCGTLTGLAGAALAFLVTQTHGPIVVKVLLVGAGLAIAGAAVILLATVLRPRLGTAGFCLYATMSTNEIGALFAKRAAHDLRASDLRFLSELACRKNRRLRVAVDCLICGVALLGLALVAGAIWS